MNSNERTHPEDLSGLSIRKMTLDDLKAVVAIDQASFSLPWPERSFQFELTENETSRSWVVELDGHVVAMMVSWQIIDELHVATIATHPDFRGQGIGKKILLYALRAAQAEGVVRSFLEVRASNEVAQKMYREFGFEEDGRRKEYYKDNLEDAILMTLNDFDRLPGG